jgi:N-acetylneuraminic acid mutarotase
MLTRFAPACLLLVAVPALAAGPQLPAMPKAVSSFGAVETDGYLYLYGGHAGKTHTYSTDDVMGTFHRLKLDGGTKWEPLPGGPIAQGLNLTAHKGLIYRAGGMQPKNKAGEPSDNHSLADVARFDPASGKWESLPPLPAPRSSHDLVTAGDKLVIVGGWQMKGKGEKPEWPNTALVLDLAAAKPEWKEIPQPFKRRALTAVAVGTKVYAIGGLGLEGAERRVDVLDVATGKWSEGPDLPGSDRNAFSPTACAVGGRVVVNTSAGPVYRLTEKGDGWEKVGDAATKRMVARLIPLGADRVVLLGGATGVTGNADSLEVIPFGKPEKVTADR